MDTSTNKRKQTRKTEMTRGERMVNIFRYLVERRSNAVTVTQVKSMLENIQPPVSLKNVQRDLKALCEMDGAIIEMDRIQGKQQYYIKSELISSFSIPLQNNGILILFLLKRLQPFIAPTSRSADEIVLALTRLAENSNSDLFEDLDEQLIDASFIFGERPLLTIDERLIDNLLNALINKRKLEITYRSGDINTIVPKTICPVKLVLHKQELYFVCMSEKSETKNYWIKICRIVTAKLTEIKFTVSKNRLLNIQTWLSNSFGILDDSDAIPRKVVLKFPRDMELLLSERRFHPSQKLSRDADDNVIMNMVVAVSQDLSRWVLGWGERVEVVEPEELRQAMGLAGQKLCGIYKK